MSQASMTINDGSGAAVLTAISQALAALASLNSGASEPSQKSAFMPWIDTSVTPNILRLRSSDNTAWIAIGDVTQVALGLAALKTANLWGANQRPNYDPNQTVSGGGSLTYNGATMAQIQAFTISGAGGVTFAAPTKIVEGMPYTFILIEGDATVRAYSYNAAFINSASMPTASVGVSGKKTTLNFVGGASNTLIFNGGVVGS